MLIGLREFQPDKADVIHKYTTEEVRTSCLSGDVAYRVYSFVIVRGCLVSQEAENTYIHLH